jgi:parvulin-like peptidyl-prolyl isomerase
MYKQQLAIMRENLLAGVLMFDLQDKLVTEQDIRAYYEANKEKLEQAKARHILIPVGKDGGLTDAQAKAKALDIRKRILAGEKFAELAKAESGDAGTKDDGGELQPFAKGVMVPEFEEAAWSLRPGEISQPVKTEFGYHIIQVDKREVPSFEQAKDALADKLRQEKFEKFYDDLKQKANPQLDPAYFPAPKAPAKPD